MTSATAFTSPISTKKNAITQVTSDAFIGSSFDFVLVYSSHLFSNGIWNNTIHMKSHSTYVEQPLHCLRADEMVAAASPIGIMGHQMAISAIIKLIVQDFT